MQIYHHHLRFSFSFLSIKENTRERSKKGHESLKRQNMLRHSDILEKCQEAEGREKEKEAERGRKLEARGSRQSSYEISTHLARSQRNTGWPQTGGNPSYPRYVSWDNNDPGRSCKGRRHTVPCHRPSDPPLAAFRSLRDCRTAPRKCSTLERRASCTSTCNNSPWCATEIVLKSEYFSLSLSFSPSNLWSSIIDGWYTIYNN